MMTIAMALISSRRFGARYERGVLASAALVIFAVVITIADASRRIRQPVTMTDGPILYYIHDPDHLETDKELAAWAFAHWTQASEGRIRFDSTEDRHLASIEVSWNRSSVPGRYGEMRPTFINGHRAATIAVHPDITALGSEITVRSKRDPLLHDVLVYLTCLHEIGHALGLTHTEASEDIMYAFRQRGHIPSFFERYRNQVSRRADIRSHSAISDTDASRLLAIH